MSQNKLQRSDLTVRASVLPKKFEFNRQDSLVNYIQKNAVSNKTKEDQPCCSKTFTENNIKTENVKINAVDTLCGFKKKEYEDYFKGSKEKKQRKKKVKNKKVTDLREFMSENTQNKINDESVPEPSTSYLSQIIENKRIKLINTKIQNDLSSYQRMILVQNKNNNIQQRVKEEEFLEQQEILAETWYTLLKKRSEIKKKAKDLSEESFKIEKRKFHLPRYEISLLSKKYWSDQDCSSFKEVKEKGICSKSTNCESTMEKLENDFEKLDFIDEEENGEICVPKRCQELKISDRI